MPREELILRTRLAPPRPHRHTLPRPSLTARLREALHYRLTLVHAGTGYGKTTALSALADSDNTAWYSISDSDTDPHRFLSYLVAACRARAGSLSDLPQAILQDANQDGSPDTWTQVIDALLNALADCPAPPALLVLDDFHFVSASPAIMALAERFIANLPPALHVIIATRYPLQSKALTAWRVRGELLELDRQTLAFQPAEIDTLFRETYGLSLSADELAALADRTEGWPIALQLVWQGLRGSPSASASALLVKGSGGSLNALFEFLANEVLGRLPAEVVDFLLDTSILRELTPAACEAVTGRGEADTVINHLLDLDLFVVALGEGHYRYHHLFHDFLRDQLAADPERAARNAIRAAEHFSRKDDADEAIYHWLKAGRFEAAARQIESAGEQFIRLGRLDTVARWIDSLPPEIVADHPLLQRLLGDLCRLRSRFDEALAWYQTAERTWRMRGDLGGISRALRGQALVYLDTVRPAQAESLLEEALRLSDGLADREARARMLELLAENKLNMGKPGEAEALRAEARSLREEGPGEDVLSVRVKVRTGRLEEAGRILQGWLETERNNAAHGQAHPPRAHRETVLLLSLIHSMCGQAESAFALAQEGIELGQRLQSPFVTAVAHIRLGHAWQVQARAHPTEPAPARDKAIHHYLASIALGDQISVRRIRAEAMWGLTSAHGLFGDLASAERTAAEGIEIGRWAGDLWVTSLIELTLGASYVIAARPLEAVETLSRALQAFRECGDSHGRAAARLWLCLAYYDLKQHERFAASADDLLTLCQNHGYDFLFTRPILLGPPDPRRAVPILIEARNRRLHPGYANRLLAGIGLPHIRLHPGYQLRVQTLGAFRVWRGSSEIDPREWQRDKARQIFQLLLIQRSRPLQREEITDRLWPSLPPEVANRDFKVALNALNKVLEPRRPADTPSTYIARDGAAYCLRPDCDLWLDLTEFEREAECGLHQADSPDPAARALAVQHLKAALAHYRGDFLPDALYDDWAANERERLLGLYLRLTDKLAGLILEDGQYEETLDLCQRILARDACWERAYRLMMTAYARLGNRPQAHRVYQRCVAALRAELDVAPSPATVRLHEHLSRDEAV